jgi:hypothetical protein
MKINLKLLMVALREVGGRSRTKGREDGLLGTRDFGDRSVQSVGSMAGLRSIVNRSDIGQLAVTGLASASSRCEDFL